MRDETCLHLCVLVLVGVGVDWTCNGVIDGIVLRYG